VVQDRLNDNEAVVVVPEAVVRTVPLERSQSAYALHDGAEITILAEREDWLQITDASNRRGWIKRDQVALVVPQKV
jgi:uncharacterized protein YgiM (DUF1202 family)